MFLAVRFSLLLFVGFSTLHLALGGCPSPPRLEYGELTDASLNVTALPVGTNLTYQCRPGYIRMPGKTNSITCLATNGWSEIQEFCDRRECGSPGELVNGDVALSPIPGTDVLDTKFGATATFTCNEGYNLIGRNVRTCTATGWNNAVPQCEVVICASPPSIANGVHTDSDKTEFQYQSAVIYSCRDATFTLLGNPVLSCTQYGNWSGPPPTCTVISCSDPSVANAVKTAGFGPGPFNYGYSITFECKEGFTMKGEAIVKCSESSMWSPALPTCDRDAVTTTAPSTTIVTKPNTVVTTTAPSTTIVTKPNTVGITTAPSTTIVTKPNTVAVTGSTGNGGHNGGSVMLIATVIIMKWLMVHSS